MKKLILLLFIPLISFSSFGQSEIEYKLVGELNKPYEIQKKDKYSSISHIYITPDEDFLILRWSNKMCRYSIHHFPSLKLIGTSNGDNWGDQFYYKPPESGSLQLSETYFIHYDSYKNKSFFLTIEQKKNWDINFKINKGKGIPAGFVELTEIKVSDIRDGVVFKSKKLGKLIISSSKYGSFYINNVLFYKEL